MALEEEKEMLLAQMRKHTKGMKYDDCFYDGVVTLDPSEIDEAWDKLTVNPMLINLKFFPQDMAMAFFDTLKERGHIR
ncbi:MAG: hypothetical protein K8953_07040 [Proteobacteria bacterium]|nr:hypothetical protein [Pseudomonadota bacterium]